jgi:hypothetical protein
MTLPSGAIEIDLPPLDTQASWLLADLGKLP